MFIAMLSKAFVVAVLSAAMLGTGACHAGTSDAQGGASGTGTTLPKLVDLGANRCIPCKKMAPILDELGREFAGRFEVQFIDVWQDHAAGERYGIRVIPTQIFFDAQGKELFRHAGFYSRAQILSRWRALGFAFGVAPGEAR